MAIPSNILTFFIFLFPTIFFCISQATTFEITNQCSYTVWAAAVPGGGKHLEPDETWLVNIASDTNSGRIWGRTNCTFNATGKGRCETGDCNNQLECKDNGALPVTLAEFALNQYDNLDFYDLSLVDGFNIPMEFSPNSSSCRGIKCAADINAECPVELRTKGGCNHPCNVFKNDLYCCTSGNCTATYLSDFFKTKCPDAYSYAMDDQTSTFTCPTGSKAALSSTSSPMLLFSWMHRLDVFDGCI
ncbi:hypothetical protein NE237_001322 [Protea cynaroides]|uniref:Thaumatin-like protein n=1 Tax=Protea cynaroides TaxID=273540 RepID=A0A9Q0KTR8_9MAGN|nr:hypothetical protein NE237_001322 [Protea cynaroides]